MIIITGATGQLGSLIVQRLLHKLPVDQIGVSVRDTDKAAAVAGQGVRVRYGDFTDPGSLSSAFEDASGVLIVSSNSAGEQAVDQHIAAIDAARDAGAKRLFYTSHQGAAADSFFAPMRDHAATTDYLQQVGIPYTALRNGYYAATVPLLLGAALSTGRIAAPADGPVSWTTHADLAEADAAILADPDRFDGQTPPLTARHGYDLAAIAEILSELTGRRIERVVLDDDEWLQGLVGRGVPEQQAELLLGTFRASRRGEFAVTDPTLENLLGRPAQSIRAVLQEAITAG